jgi:hypothetical protein
MSEFKVRIGKKEYIAYAENQSELEEVLSEAYPDVEDYVIEEVK